MNKGLSQNHQLEDTSSVATTESKRLKNTTFIVLVCVLGFLFLTAAITIYRQYQHSWDMVELEATASAQKFERWLTYPLRFFDGLPLEKLANGSADEASFFNQIINRSSRFYAVRFVDSFGQTVKYFGTPVQSKHDENWTHKISNLPKVSYLQFGQSFYEEKAETWLLPVRHMHPVGKEKLIAIAYLDGRAFERIFNTLHPEGKGSLSIFRHDGVMLARIPFAQELVGKSFADGKLFGEILPSQPNGLSLAPKSTDGVERIVAHKSLTSYPLVLTFGIDIDHIQDVSFMDLLVLNSPFIGICIIALLFTMKLWEQLNKTQVVQANLIRAQNELHELASVDPLTGCMNRRSFMDRAEVERARFKRNRTAFSVVMIDLDHFKEVNDTYGHVIGDEILKQFSTLIMDKLRLADFLGRYGGEEFILFLPETPLGPAIEVADRLRKIMDENPLNIEDYEISVTFSAGVATVHHADETLEEIIKRADQSLYIAKNEGRNMVKADTSVPYL